MNYIFVDFDGPLLSSKSLYIPRNRLKFRTEEGLNTHFDEFSVWAHNMWAKYADAKIIFSTNWILHKTEDDLKQICKNNGLNFEGRYYENFLTTTKKFTSERGSEVWWTITDIAKEGDRFLIVDDDQTIKWAINYAKKALQQAESDRKYETATNWHEMDDPPHVEWINVDSIEGLSLKNFRDGGNFFGFNEYGLDTYTPWDYMNYAEFDTEMKTKEEKEEHKKLMDMLVGSMI